MPINEKGYLRSTYDDILADRIALAQELFGKDIDTSNASALGKFIRLSVQDLADAYEAQEIIYYSRFPNTANGQSLDRLMPFAGITRNPPTRAEHEIKLKGTANYQIDPGFLVGTKGDEEFFLVNTVVLDENGEGTGVVQSTELGTTGNVLLGTITEIVNPSVDVTSVEHTNIISLGEDEETDAELRKRFAIAIQGSGSATAVAIRGAVMRVTGVNSCLIVENKEDSTDADGRPPHSFEVYVHAPSTADQQIGEAIFSKKPLGIKSVGDVEVQVQDISGGQQTVYFSHVEEVSLYIKVKICKDSHFEIDGVDQIKTALVGYIESLGSGEDVIFTNLYRYIYSVEGVKDVASLTISKDGTTYVSQNIIIDPDEISRLDAVNIQLEVTAYEDQ